MGDLGKAMTKTEANSGAQQNGGKHRVHNYPANPNDRGHRAHQEVNNAYHGIAMQPQINQESQYAPVNQTAMMKPQQQLQQAQLQMQMHGNSTQNEVVNSNGSSIHFQHQHQHQHPIQAQVPQNIQINAMPNGTIMPQHTGKQVQVAQRGRFSIIKDVKQKPGDASNTNGIATTMEDGSINSQVPQQQQQQQQQQQHVGPSQGSIASSVPQQHSMQQQPQAPATSRGGNSVPSGMIMANPVSVSSGETEVKGRFLVSKSKDALGENNHVRSQSLGATPMAGILNQTNMQQHPTAMPPHQHALQPNQIPVQIQIGHQMNHTPGVTVDSRGQQIPILVQPAVGLHTALPNTVPHTAPGSTKPPKVPKSTKGVERINNTSGGASKGGLSCAVPGGVGKMFHFLDQFKLEVVEADKLVKSLQSDVKFLRGKNKELEARCKDSESRYLGEKEAREESDAKVRALKRRVKELKESAQKIDDSTESNSQTIIPPTHTQVTSEVLATKVNDSEQNRSGHIVVNGTLGLEQPHSTQRRSFVEKHDSPVGTC